MFGLSCLTPVHAKDVSLRDKIGQMIIVGFDGKKVDLQSPVVQSIDKENIGGVILFDYNVQTEKFDKNIESPVQLTKLNQSLQRYTKRANQLHHRPLLPLLISVDYEGGQVNRLSPQYGFPETVSAAKAGTMKIGEVSPLAHQMAQTLKSTGFNVNLAPVVDVNVNPKNPIIGLRERSFSADPKLVALHAELYTQQFLSKKIQCAYKHFPGHGSSDTDSHLGFVDVTNTWQSYELEPYAKLFSKDKSCGMVMTAHIINRNLDDSGLPATLSHKILTNLLREQLNFDGVIITDDMQMDAIDQYFGVKESVILAVNAGADMLIFGNQLSEKFEDPAAIIDIIEDAVHAGTISEQRINESYQRIVTLKQTVMD